MTSSGESATFPPRVMINLRIVPASAFSPALEVNLRRLGKTDKVYKHFLAAVRWSFDADVAWLYRRLRHNRRVHEKLVIGEGSLCNDGLLEPFARLEHPALPRTALLAPFLPHHRVEGIVGVARRGREFEVGRGRSLNRLTALLAKEIERRDEEALERVLNRIQERAFSGLHARDLTYQIFDALHQLIRYDHSASLLRYEQSRNAFRIVAEKIVWQKGKSRRVGLEAALASELRQELARDEVVITETAGPRTEETKKVSNNLIASVTYRSRLIGLLSLASSERLSFDVWDRAIVERFLPVAAFCLRPAER